MSLARISGPPIPMGCLTMLVVLPFWIALVVPISLARMVWSGRDAKITRL